MNEITLEVNQQKETFASVWVHLQEVSANSVPYRIRVPASNIVGIFDSDGMKDINESWTVTSEK